jgi:hypothetical protein
MEATYARGGGASMCHSDPAHWRVASASLAAGEPCVRSVGYPQTDLKASKLILTELDLSVDRFIFLTCASRPNAAHARQGVWGFGEKTSRTVRGQ